MAIEVSHYGLSALLLVLSTTGAISAPCSNVIPGVYRQSRGVDVTMLDLMPLDAMHAEDGYRNPVVDFTCDEGKTRTIGGVTYNTPDQVWLVSDLPSGSLQSSVQVMKTSSEVRNSFSVNAGVDVNTKKVAFSASASYSKMQKTVLKNEKRVQSVSASFSSRHVQLKHADSLSLGADAQREIDELPTTYTANTAAYETFINHFGTHYIKEAKFGGLMMMYTETDSSYHETHDEQTVSAQASATFGQALTVKGGTTVSSANIDSTFTAKTTQSIRYFGGQWNLMVSDGLTKWQPTIDASPWLFSTKLERISDLIQDSSRKTAMNQAIDDYLMRKYVTVELMRILDTLPSTAQSYPEAVTMRNKINAMSSQYPLVESEVTSLGDEVDHWYRVLMIRYDNTYLQFSAASSYDGTVNFVCPPGKTITGIKSWHHGHYEDRQWQFKCGYTPNLYPLANCRWSGYVNEYDATLNYKCPGTSAIKGWYSVHHNHYEDRKHQFMCCDIQGLGETNCAWSSYMNSMDGGMDFSYTPSEKYINGAYSYHSNHHEDRRWQFYVCTV